MTSNIAQPFTADDKKRMDDHLAEIDEAEKLIAKGKLGGLDLSASEAKLKDSKTRLRKLRNAFFPNA